MKNDNELLRLAAKAAGAKMSDYSDGTPDHWIIQHQDNVWRKWRPLTDDGDAMRLATSLQLSISWFTTLQYVMVERRGFGENIGWTDDAGRDGAVRRAITVAAAQIGSTLP